MSNVDCAVRCVDLHLPMEELVRIILL